MSTGNKISIDHYSFELKTEFGILKLFKIKENVMDVNFQYTIFKYEGKDIELVIPEIYNGYRITSIYAKAFQGCGLTKVEIPNTIEIIGNEAFADCVDLVSVKFSNRLKVIGNRAFHNCTKLTQITIPSSVEELANDAFIDFETNDNKRKLEIDSIGDDLMHDPLTRKVAEYIVRTKDASISTIQREFNLGFNRANSLIEFFELVHIISKAEGIKPRKVIASKEDLSWILGETIVQ